MIATPDDILLVLGYGRTIPTDVYDKLDDITYYLGNRVDSLMTAIAAIDAALSDAPLDSMAVKIDKLEVSYTQHLVLLKQEGSRLIQELSLLLDIPVRYDRYSGVVPGIASKTSRKTNFTSYW